MNSQGEEMDEKFKEAIKYYEEWTNKDNKKKEIMRVGRFVKVLYTLLQHEIYCKWDEKKTSFIVTNADRFMPRWRKLGRYKANEFPHFVRQLNMYGFNKNREASIKLTFSRKYFYFGSEELLLVKRKTPDRKPMYRRKPKKHKTRSTKSKKSEKIKSNKEVHNTKSNKKEIAEAIIAGKKMMNKKNSQKRKRVEDEVDDTRPIKKQKKETPIIDIDRNKCGKDECNCEEYPFFNMPVILFNCDLLHYGPQCAKPKPTIIDWNTWMSYY